MSQTLAMNSGIVTVPRIATSQLICLDFDGGLTSYNGELFSIEQVEVGNAGLSEHQIAQIVAKLNAEFEGQNVVFTADMPASGEYSTVFIGKTSAFEPFGTFAGIAETIDSGNKNKNDKAFVILKGGETTDEIANIISHETGHLLGTFDHGGAGVARYAYTTSTIAPGVTSSNLTVSGGQTLKVFGSAIGVTASGVDLNQGSATLYIASGGYAENVTLRYGAIGYMDSRGSMNSVFVSSGAILQGGGTGGGDRISNLCIYSGGKVNILSRGTVDRVSIYFGGKFFCYGGSVDNFTLYSGGTFNGYRGSLGNGTVMNGGVLALSSGMSYGGGRLAVSSGGELILHSGVSQTGSGLCVFSGGTLNGMYHQTDTIHSSGSNFAYNNCTVFSSASLSSGDTAKNIIVSGTLNVNEGRIWEADVRSGGSLFLSGPNVLESAYVAGYLKVASGLADRVTILDGGQGTIISGASCTKFTVQRQGCLTVRGLAISTSVLDGGNMIVGGHAYTMTLPATARDVRISSGGLVNIEDGGLASNGYISSGGTMTMSGNCEVKFFNISSGGVLLISGGSTAAIRVLAGGQINGFTRSEDEYRADGFTHGVIHSNTYVQHRTTATLYNSTTSAVGTEIRYGGFMDVRNGGWAGGTVVNSGGTLQVVARGRVSGTTILKGGSMALKSVGGATGGTVYGELTLSGSQHDGYGASDFCIASGGNVNVFSGGRLYGVTVKSGGRLTISQQGGEASRGIIVSSGGIVNGFTFRKEKIYSSLSWYRTCYDSTTVSGTASLYANGIAADTVIASGGTLTIMPTAKLTNTLRIDSNAVLLVSSGGIIDFNIARITPHQPALINNWYKINDLGATLTLTVSATGQRNGKYILSDNAHYFDKSLTVSSETGKSIGQLSVGGTLANSGETYALTKEDGLLILSVSGGKAPTARSDIDGNGVSDVMFQYKVDHQIGFWMNGSNTWKGQGLSEPAEWEVVGAYDMNANGKADVVMLGNVTVNGVKGAYVGYRKDGDTSTWETISYLKNPDNVQWNAKVGNMTGNAGKNSIVWHAAELGAVGVWTDGTDNWVAISGGFDKNWTMLGTGDFNGNGKDEILFLYNGSLYTTDIDGNFVSLGNAAGWNVCAIGDFSADGKDDLILFHKETGSVMKYENGQSSQWSSLGQLDAGDWFIVGAGDYNGDGKDDLLVRQYSTGMLGYYAEANLSKWTEMGRGVDMNWAVIA